MNQIIASEQSKVKVNRRDGFNLILKDLVNYLTDDARIFAQLLYKRGATYEELAKAKGVTKQAIEGKYPKEKHE